MYKCDVAVKGKQKYLVINITCALPPALKNTYSALNIFQNTENDFYINIYKYPHAL